MSTQSVPDVLKSSPTLAIVALAFASFGFARIEAADNWRIVRERNLGSPRMQGVSALAFASRGQVVVAGFTDGSVARWTRWGDERARFQAHDGTVNTLAVSPDGRVLATGGDDNTVATWYLRTGIERQRLSQKSRVTALAFLPGGRRLLCGGDRGELTLWDVATGRAVREVSAHHYAVLSLSTDRAGNLVATLGGDRRIQVFDVRSGKRVRELDRPARTVKSIVMSPDGEFVAGGSAGRVVLWSVSTGQIRRQWQRLSSTIEFLAYASEGRKLIGAAGSYRAEVYVWDARTGSELMSSRLSSRTRNWDAMALSPDGRTLAVGGRESLCLWSLITEEDEVSFQGTGHSGSVTAVAYAPSGNAIVTASDDRTIRFWEATTGTERRELRHVSPVSRIVLSPDGSMLVCAGGRFVNIWRIRTGKRMRFKRFDYEVHSVDLAPDGRMLVVGGADGSVRVWDSYADIQRMNLGGHRGAVRCVAYGPDGKTIASAGRDVEVNLWDARSGRRIARLQHGRRVGAIAYSPDGIVLATASLDDHIRVWQARNGDLRWELHLPRSGQKGIHGAGGPLHGEHSRDLSRRARDARGNALQARRCGRQRYRQHRGRGHSSHVSLRRRR